MSVENNILLLPLNDSPVIQWSLIVLSSAMLLVNIMMSGCLLCMIKSRLGRRGLCRTLVNTLTCNYCCKNSEKTKPLMKKRDSGEYYGMNDEMDFKSMQIKSPMESRVDNSNSIVIDLNDSGLTDLNTSSHIAEDLNAHFNKLKPVENPEELPYNDLSKELNDAIIRVSPQLRSMSISSDDLELMEQIGVGSSGVVYKARYLNVLVAVKQCLICDLLEDPLKEYMKETQIMSTIRHPNIVQFIAASIKPPFFYIVTEYCSRGSLDKLLKTSYSGAGMTMSPINHPPTTELDDTNLIKLNTQHISRFSIDDETLQGRLQKSSFKSGLTLKKKCKLLLDAANGLNYLKSKNIIHSDVKVSNCLVTNDWTLKISDFGIARLFNNKQKKHTKCGTVEITAPEILAEGHYSFKADIYSFGICIYELIFEKELYPGLNIYDITHKVIHEEMRPKIPTQTELREMFFGEHFRIEYNVVNNLIIKLITKCWSADMNARPEWEEICETLKQSLAQLSLSTNSGSFSRLISNPLVSSPVGKSRALQTFPKKKNVAFESDEE